MASAKLVPDALPEYNILLLGESGAGKNLFINSIINYVQYETLAAALNNHVSVVVPVRFTITDDHDKVHTIEESITDVNEYRENTAHQFQVTNSSTTKCRSYLINFDAFRVRLIDSPGVSSTVVETSTNIEQFDKHSERLKQDEKYVEEVLEFISHFDNIHAIAIVFKSNETRYTTRFEICLKQLLSSYKKSAMDNVIFILTFGESTRFKSDIVKQTLKTLLEKALQFTSDELLSKNKVYIVDNKGFRYLLAVKKGAWFKELERILSEVAWTQSRSECKRLIEYITGHDGQPRIHQQRFTDRISINDARKFTNIIGDLMENIIKVIDQNKKILDEHWTLATKKDEQVTHFKKQIIGKELDIEIVEVELPHMVCTSSKCTNVYTAAGEEKAPYSQICCPGCRVAIPIRLFCTAFELISGNCKVCGCHFTKHQRIYFTTEIVTKERKDKDAILKELVSATDCKQKIEKMNNFVAIQQKKIDSEMRVIESARIIFNIFLKTNPIIPCEDVSKGAEGNVSPDKVLTLKQQLLHLDMFGTKIQEAYDIATRAEEKDWLATKLDSQKEKIINAKNIFLKLSNPRNDKLESKVKSVTAMAPVCLNKN